MNNNNLGTCIKREYNLTRKAPNTTIAGFANTVELSHLDLQCLPSCFLFFNIIHLILKVFFKIYRRNFVVCFFGNLQ